MSKTYVVHARTERSTMSVGTDDPLNALNRARELERPGLDVTITDWNGNLYTVAELEANVLSGDFAKPDTSMRP